MNIKSWIEDGYLIILVSWKKEYYISRYKPLPFDKSIVEVVGTKISFSEFQELSNDYPVIKIKDDVLFNAGEEVEHILKIQNAELGRLNHLEAQMVYQKLGKVKQVLLDVQPQIITMKTPAT